MRPLLALQAAATVAATTTDNAQQPIVNPSLWDGNCTYPTADPGFTLETYLGRWYQVAGTLAPFTAGCKCITAEYALNDNGTVSVHNTCQRGEEASGIFGTASAADAVYGKDGVFRVQFPFTPAPSCPGPNYIVQDYAGDFAIVQASNFSTLFILSREQQPKDEVIDFWLEKARLLGSNLDNVEKTDQTNCK